MRVRTTACFWSTQLLKMGMKSDRVRDIKSVRVESYDEHLADLIPSVPVEGEGLRSQLEIG
jgi:hypothetical protein